MGFLAPGLLAGLLALGLPVYLHLLRQHKTTPRPFSSLMFFERRVQSSIKHRRLKYRLLFALRALFLAFLVFAFARPVIESTRMASAHSGRTLALLIDASFSMREGDRLAQAKTAAQQVAQSMRAGDRAQVIVFGGPTRLLTSVTNDREAIRSAIESVQPGDGASSYAEVARAIRSVAQNAQRPMEAHLFSDMQKSSAPASFADLRLPEGVELIPHPAAKDSIPNFAVENVIAPRRLFTAKSGRIQATVVSYSDKATKQVSLLVNNQTIETKSVEVPAFGRASVEFTGVDAPYGLTRGRVSINGGDRFPEDDHYYFAVERSDPAPALFVHEPGDTRSALYFQTALAAATQPAFNLTVVSYAQAATTDLTRFVFVILSNPSGVTSGLRELVNRYEEHGGSVLYILGGPAARSGDNFKVITQTDATHPALRTPANWDTVRFYRVAPVPTGVGRLLLRLDDGSPLLVEQSKGEGRDITFASGLDNIDNDLPVRPLFVPFVQELTAYLGRVESSTGNFTAGSFFDLRPDGAKADTHIEVTGPKGERVLSLAESTRTRSIPLEHEGFYDIRRDNGRHALAAVNPDRRESDFSILPAETVALWKNTGMDTRANASNEASNGSGQQANELWWWVLLAALALAIAESILGNRHLEQKEGTA